MRRHVGVAQKRVLRSPLLLKLKSGIDGLAKRMVRENSLLVEDDDDWDYYSNPLLRFTKVSEISSKRREGKQHCS
jgi:hypothetical protein